MDKEAMKHRTKQFALRVIKAVEALPRTRTADVIGKQLLRSATSVGANYRAACRAKSNADFINKMGTVEEESDESAYWMELLVEAGLVTPDRSNGRSRPGDCDHGGFNQDGKAKQMISECGNPDCGMRIWDCGNGLPQSAI